MNKQCCKRLHLPELKLPFGVHFVHFTNRNFTVLGNAATLASEEEIHKFHCAQCGIVQMNYGERSSFLYLCYFAREDQ